MATAYVTRDQIERSVKLLKEWGLDAEKISADTWGYSGYRLRNHDGGTWHPWPDGFPVDELVKIRGGFR